nr:hypothetical protein HK105_008371 [Polyrhizophydium stewartii]
MVDMFTLLVAPGAGDELQGMKKGIVELSDLILVNKADGELAGPARLAQIEYTSALKFIMPMTEGWYPKVLPVSSHQREGIDKAWETMKEYYGLLAERNELAAKRGAQQKKWMWRQITDELHWRLRTDPNVKGMVPEFERLVDNGEITSGQAAEEILDAFISGQSLRGSAAQKNPSVPAA